MVNGNNIESTEKNFTQSFNARDWAKAFMEQYNRNPNTFVSESVMIGWFANAIMRGYDERARQEDVNV